MNLKPFEAFRAVAMTGSTTAAAQTLDISQSAVSRLVSQLEAEMGIELFRRERGRLLPTAEARQLLDPVSEAIEGVRRVDRLAGDLRLGAAGQLLIKVAAPHSLSVGLLPEVLNGFSAAFPDAAVELLGGGYQAIARMVAAGEADLGFVGLPTSFPGLAVERIATVATVVVLPKSDALLRKKTVSAADLADRPLVMIGRRHASRLQVERAFRRAGVTPQVRMETHTVASACALVAAGLGPALVNAVMAEGFRHLGIATRPFSPSLDQDFGLAFPAGRPRARLTEALAGRIARHVSRLARSRR